MFLDQTFNFASAQSLSGTADQLSTNVFDAGSAIKLFDGEGKGNIQIHGVLTAVGGTTPTFRARVVGADDAALSTNPIILADTGVSPTLSASDVPKLFTLEPRDQPTAKRYYGVIFTQSGTSPTGTVSANGMLEHSDNLLR